MSINLQLWGHWGENPKNMARAMVNALGVPAGAPSFEWFDIPFKNGIRPHPFLLPHLFFKSLHTHDKARWIRAIRGPRGAARQFWESMAATPFVRQHPELPKGDWSKTIPLGMHGDGGSFSKQDQLYVISWNSLLGVGPTIAQRFLLTVVREKEMSDGTLDGIFEIMAWSLNVLLRGEEPRGRWDVPARGSGGLCDGYRAALCQIRGDWAFLRKGIQFPSVELRRPNVLLVCGQ